MREFWRKLKIWEMLEGLEKSDGTKCKKNMKQVLRSVFEFLVFV